MLNIRINGTSVLAGLLFCLVGVCSAAEEPLISLGPEAFKVKESSTDFNRYDLLLGEIYYAVQSGEFEGEGYAPKVTKALAGSITKRIYDYSTKDSALNIATHMEERLQKEGFEILFRCHRSACGDVAGWRLFMSEAIEGEINSQYYLAARHPDKRGNEWYVAFYVNEFTDVPRSIIHIINTSSRAFGSVSINKAALGPKYSPDKLEKLAIVEFAFGSAELSRAAQNTLTKLGQNLMDRPELILEIGGHTDAVGETEFNNHLSLLRSEKVKSWLVQEGIEPEKLQTTGYGASRLFETEHPEGQANRRVEIGALLLETSTSQQEAKSDDFTGASAEPF